MAIVLDGSNGISTPDLESAGPVTGTTGTFSGAVQASGVATNIYPLVSGTAVASTSGTSIDFTGIPSWVKRITVMFSGVSTNGTSNFQIQIGAGSVTTSGYVGSISQGISVAGFSAGFVVLSPSVAATNYHGSVTLQNINGNNWVENGVIGNSAGTPAVMLSGGSLTLSGVLDRVRITTANGTDTFDAGTINIIYEG